MLRQYRERGGHGNSMQVIETSVQAVLRERASMQPNDTAFTFVDYDQDWAGVAETLTCSQVYRRTLNNVKCCTRAQPLRGER